MQEKAKSLYKDLKHGKESEGSSLMPAIWSSLVAQMVKNLPVMQETWVQSLGWEDPLENG